MFFVTKRIEISAAHSLELPYKSPCSNLHGHNWIITVEVCSESLVNGMVVDFSVISDVVKRLDHTNLNQTLPNINPTAENIAKWICDTLDDLFECHLRVTKVSVQESEGNIAWYIP